jgi:hypothetical protein
VASETLVQTEIYNSLMRLTQERDAEIASSVALAMLEGACRALCRIKAGQLDALGLQRLVLASLASAQTEIDETPVLRH